MGEFPMDLEPRLLRSFVAVGEELHFTRAASRLFLTQQAVSRHISRLEEDLGVELVDRTSRKVELTEAGRRLLPAARELLALHDRVVTTARGRGRPLLVDVLGEGLTPALLVEEARRAAPGIEFLSRFSGGVGVSMTQLLGRQVDVAFGRSEGGRTSFDSRALTRRLVRLEPLGLLVLEDHPLADAPSIPSGKLADTEIDISAGSHSVPEWIDLAERFLQLVGAEGSPPHEPAMGAGETARHLRSHGRPILAMTSSPEVAGAVLVPITNPVPLYPWAIMHHRDLDHPGLGRLHEAIDLAVGEWSWLERATDSWMPIADAGVFDL